MFIIKELFSAPGLTGIVGGRPKVYVDLHLTSPIALTNVIKVCKCIIALLNNDDNFCLSSFLY